MSPTAVPPAQVDYVTPAQQEGPYDPVEKPVDRDNDLVDFAGANGVPAGEILVLAGVVYDAAGRPVEGATVEIWQTDNRGVYDHPGDPGTERRDCSFQFYGVSVTGSDASTTSGPSSPGATSRARVISTLK